MRCLALAAAVATRPTGTYTKASRSTLMRSDAVPAELLLRVGQLARVLHQEARLAHELTRGPGPDLAALGLVLGVDDLFLFLFFVVVHDDEPILEDGVEVGLDIVGVLFLFL